MKRWKLVAVVLALGAGTLVATAVARDEDDPADAHVREIAALVVDEPDVPAKLFAKAFLDAVPPAKIGQLLAGMFKEGGKVASVRRVSGDRLSGRFVLTQERGNRSECTIGVTEKPPHKIVTLYLKPLGMAARSLEEL